jgi:hypothetical protein
VLNGRSRMSAAPSQGDRSVSDGNSEYFQISRSESTPAVVKVEGYTAISHPCRRVQNLCACHSFIVTIISNQMKDGLIAIGDLSRQSPRLALARIGPDCSILCLVASVPVSHYFLSTNTCDKTQAAEDSEGNVEEVVAGL